MACYKKTLIVSSFSQLDRQIFNWVPKWSSNAICAYTELFEKAQWCILSFTSRKIAIFTARDCKLLFEWQPTIWVQNQFPISVKTTMHTAYLFYFISAQKQVPIQLNLQGLVLFYGLPPQNMPKTFFFWLQMEYVINLKKFQKRTFRFQPHMKDWPYWVKDKIFTFLSNNSSEYFIWIFYVFSSKNHGSFKFLLKCLNIQLKYSSWRQWHNEVFTTKNFELCFIYGGRIITNSFINWDRGTKMSVAFTCHHGRSNIVKALRTRVRNLQSEETRTTQNCSIGSQCHLNTIML